MYAGTETGSDRVKKQGKRQRLLTPGLLASLKVVEDAQDAVEEEEATAVTPAGAR
jgi:hypothetical protein